MMMKPIGLAAAAAFTMLTAFAKEPWRDPTVSSVNRLPARAFAAPCESAELARDIALGRRPITDSKWILSLDGTWDFRWKHDVDAADWEKTAKIAVPSCWQLQGEYDPPLYTNRKYPLQFNDEGDPMAEPPEGYTSYKYRNPVGLYSRTFALPADWEGRRTVIRFHGVSSAMYVRVNGREIGYSEDSRLPAEFDITAALVPPASSNLLEVTVLKHCDGSFIEDQDFWRLSGIFRSVFLVSEKADAPKDLVVETTLSDDFGHAAAVIRDEGGRTLLAKTYDAPRLWSPGTPELYCETVGAAGDFRAVTFGFRKVEIRDSVVRVNGERILVFGVNRHEMEPATGYTVTEAGMRRDIEIMRDLNVNAVRTCHYPDDPRWYDLCDREGFFVCCEANVEAHGVPDFYGACPRALPKNPLFHDAIVERQTRMVRTYRNHPSIVFWSLGNESGDGPAMADGYRAVKAIDATRPVQYEGAQDSDHSDVKCPMYARPWDCEDYVKNNPKKPFILCEYIHAMGNSTGDIGAYWKLAEKYPSFQGGFIWDFADQALWKRRDGERGTGDGGEFLAYGGDFGDVPNDDNFNCNGVVAADRTYHPGAYEVRHFYGRCPAKARPAFTPSAVPDAKCAQDPELAKRFRLNFWRAPTDNDRGWKMPQVCGVWKEATERQQAPDGATADLRVTKLAEGKALVELAVKVGEKMPPAPRIGVTFTVPREFFAVRWTGLGPWENYPDRCAAADFGTFTAMVGVSSGLARNGAIAYVPNALNPDNYVEPGEQGYRTGCSALAFGNAAGKEIRITALDAPFGFNAWPYSQRTLEAARHQFELKDEGEITVNVDAAMMGVGGDNSWGAKPHDEHMPGAGEYALRFVIEGL